MDGEKKMKRRKKQKKKVSDLSQQFQGVEENSYQDADPENIKHPSEQDAKRQDFKQSSQKNLKQADDQTMGESLDQNLPCPYQFLKFAEPRLHMIFFPHFTMKSVTFVLTILYLILFITEIIYIYTRQIQNDYTWNCSLFELQNKYYPRIKFDYQIWRLLVSGFFHSNYAHFILNVLGMQMYGYFVQWYYGKCKYVTSIVLSIIFAGFFSNITNMTSISTMPSSVLYCILALKIYFLYEYRDYKKLTGRRVFIILLLVLIFGINLIPIFTNNNVDYSSSLGGLICGLLLGLFFHLQKMEQELLRGEKILKFGSLALLIICMIICCVLTFTLAVEEEHLLALNEGIEKYCS